MNGTIVINNIAGRSLRQRCAALSMQDVIDCAGDFAAGDRVYIAFRGKDGGQYVVAIGIVCCSAAMLRYALATSVGEQSNVSGDNISDVVIREEGLVQLWPSDEGIA